MEHGTDDYRRNIGGGTTHHTIDFSGERLLLSDLILQRVAARVRELEADVAAHAKGHFFQSPEEQLLYAAQLRGRTERARDRMRSQRVDTEEAGYRALAAFQQNGFFVIVDDRQRSDLEEEILLTPRTTIRFLRLTPLIGG